MLGSLSEVSATVASILLPVWGLGIVLVFMIINTIEKIQNKLYTSACLIMLGILFILGCLLMGLRSILGEMSGSALLLLLVIYGLASLIVYNADNRRKEGIRKQIK